MRYDPLVGPDATEWLELAEGEQTELVLRYHRRQRLRMGKLELHALIHTTVETQLAQGHLPAKAGSIGSRRGPGSTRSNPRYWFGHG